MRAQGVDPDLIYPDSRLFLDYVGHREELCALFERGPAAFQEVAELRAQQEFQWDSLCNALADYNGSLGASEPSLANIERLRTSGSLCVITGQQAGFLGGPAYTAYKILTAIRLARRLTIDLGVPVAPIFWLASEDHDFTEINRVRWMAADGALRTASFDWEDKGRAIEALPLTDDVRAAASEVAEALDYSPDIAALLAPTEDDDYARWHARIWSRLFGDDGLILVEPRVIRHLAAPFFQDVLAQRDAIRAGLEETTRQLGALGYEPALDPQLAGRPFVLSPTGSRVRSDAAGSDPSAIYSADAALRPVLADSLFPTVASVLGPGEIAYHAQLRPIYQSLGVAQPVFVARHGYTLVAESDAELLDRLEIPLASALDPSFDLQPLLDARVPDALQTAFTDARSSVRDALSPLQPVVRTADPGLEARWRQVADRADREIAQLQDRVARAELARAGISVRRLRAAIGTLRPGDRPQERALSLVHFLARYGVQWLHQLPGAEHPERFSHYVVMIHDRA